MTNKCSEDMALFDYNGQPVGPCLCPEINSNINSPQPFCAFQGDCSILILWMQAGALQDWSDAHSVWKSIKFKFNSS